MELKAASKNSNPFRAYADASFDLSGRCGLAILVTTPDGQELRYSASLPSAGSHEAEKEAVLEAARRLQWMNAASAVIFTDCTGAIVTDLPYPVVWIPREENRAADALSRIARVGWDTVVGKAPRPRIEIAKPLKQGMESPGPTAIIHPFEFNPRDKVSANIERFFRANPTASLDDLMRAMPLPEIRVANALMFKAPTWFRFNEKGEIRYNPDGSKNRDPIQVVAAIRRWCVGRGLKIGGNPANLVLAANNTLRHSLSQRIGTLAKETTQPVVAISEVLERLTPEQRDTWATYPNQQLEWLSKHFAGWWKVGGLLVNPKAVLSKDILERLWSELGLPVNVTRPSRWPTQARKHLLSSKSPEDQMFRHQYESPPLKRLKVKNLADSSEKFWWITDTEARKQWQEEKDKKKRESLDWKRERRKQQIRKARWLLCEARRLPGRRKDLGLPPLRAPWSRTLTEEERECLVSKEEARRLFSYPPAYLEEAVRRGLWRSVAIENSLYVLAPDVWFTKTHAESWEPILNDCVYVPVDAVRRILGMDRKELLKILQEQRIQTFAKHGREWVVRGGFLKRGDVLRLIQQYALGARISGSALRLLDISEAK
ncbi:hypothetical protein CVV65_05570 [Kyrpidia spormannii]|uniref:Uncharacterized protein n=1 Tax=Kyrpidia spormannii TaxID=2055160 RepID=A0A2K8N548_9BACL|nr:hypothetical protein [Kyrpidia spormannii]ATY84491.1 hypothetical protein CVV65_05570 [Kyrpidia spormannii]